MELVSKKYRHYKGGEYEVIGIAKDSETLKEIVVYRALYKSDVFGDNVLWTRPLSEFLGLVTVDGKSIPRFMPVKE